MKEDLGIYIHIPFCMSKCYYCDFVSYSNMDEIIEKYIDALCIEILKNSEILSQYNIKTVYFGGGTPSYIKSEYIEKIMKTLKMFSKNDEEKNNEFSEVTIELNPNSTTLKKLLQYKDCGINRISLGVQSTNDAILKNIGRAHSYKDIIISLENIKKAGFKNISIDLIYPLPGLDIKTFKSTLNDIKTFKEKYDIKHISIYNLEIHENTKLDFLLKEHFLSLPDEDTEYEMKELVYDTLLKYGFEKYEISNYSLKGYESKHNLVYWNQEKYLGFGASASSFFYGCRYKNTDNINEYINGIFNDEDIVIQREQLDKLSLMKEYIILKLRLKSGIDVLSFNKKFDTNIFDLFKQEFDYFINNGLIIYNDNKLYLSKRGTEVANIVWQKFI